MFPKNSTVKSLSFINKGFYWQRWLLPAVCLMCLIGCSADLGTRLMIHQMKPFLKKSRQAIYNNNDPQMVRLAMPSMIVQLESMLQASPGDVQLLTYTAQTIWAYSLFFEEDKDPAYAEELYHKAYSYALGALKQKKQYLTFADKPIEEYKKGLQIFTKKDVPALLITASAWLSWIQSNPDIGSEVFNDFKRIEALLDRVIELDETYQNGAVHALYGAYHAGKPVWLDGNPKLAQAHFKKAFEISNNQCLLWHYLYAKYYAVQIKDKTLFEKTLNHIISASEDLLEQNPLINHVARIKATHLISQADQLF